MGSECSVFFAVNFILGTEPSITFESVAVSLVAGFVSKWYWVCRFIYTTGDPASTEFRLNSADGLTGTFSPNAPINEGNNPNKVRNGLCHGIVTKAPGTGDATYNGTISIL